MPPNAARSEDAEIRAAVQALQAGAGEDAFEVIFRRFYRPLHRFFANRPALRQEADDLTQATLIRALEKIHQYRCEASFEAWLLRIATNVWKNAVREHLAAKRAPGEAQELLDPTREAPSPSPPLGALWSDEPLDPEALALAEERTRVLRGAIEALPAGMRKCTELRLYGDLEYHEIADVTGIGLNSVRSQLFEARKRLKPLLDQYFQGAVF